MIALKTNLCAYCGACVSVCPRDAMQLDNFHLEIDEKICDGCEICLKVCPLNALEEENNAR